MFEGLSGFPGLGGVGVREFGTSVKLRVWASILRDLLLLEPSPP